MNLMNDIIVIDNVFSKEELQIIHTELKLGLWNFVMKTLDDSKRTFWKKEINTKITNIFYEKIKNGIRRDIRIAKIHMNGQSHGQSADWHTDTVKTNYFTMIFFPYKWRPEFGGHLLIEENNKIISIIPEYNKGIIFKSSYQHIALEPTNHCTILRESIACVFEVS